MVLRAQPGTEILKDEKSTHGIAGQKHGTVAARRPLRGKKCRRGPLPEQAGIIEGIFSAGVVAAQSRDFDDDRAALTTGSDGIAAKNEVSPSLIAEHLRVSNVDRFSRRGRQRNFGCGQHLLLVQVA
jgi:hypothetical protein